MRRKQKEKMEWEERCISYIYEKLKKRETTADRVFNEILFEMQNHDEDIVGLNWKLHCRLFIRSDILNNIADKFSLKDTEKDTENMLFGVRVYSCQKISDPRGWCLVIF